MRWRYYAFWGGLMFVPFAIMGEGFIGLAVLGVFAGLNIFVERRYRPSMKTTNAFESWKKYRKKTLEDMR
jgi:hypothetical protein|tara:strand:+ start:4529 stop:4738 length:210 start_codon:yes stop_codon:yes gene_type:complete